MELSISIPTKSQISKYNSGGDHLDPAICPFEGFLERREVPPNLMGPPKILYLSVRSDGSSNLSKYCLQIGSSKSVSALYRFV